jgi:hypothetical protein
MITEIKSTATTPLIVLDYAKNIYLFEGESFPEDVNDYFDPIMHPLEDHLRKLQNGNIQMDFFLTYFNSASTKVFFNLFNLLEEVSEFNSVTVNWKYHAEDDTAEEFGQEFKEDLVNVEFNFVAI